jgi:hypothetical protein
VTANRGFALDEMDPDPVAGQIESSLDAGYTSPDNDHITHQK